MKKHKKAKKQRLKAEAAEERAKRIEGGSRRIRREVRRIECQAGGSGYNEAEPARIDASIQIEPATYNSTPMFMHPLPTMPPFHLSPVMPPVAAMPGIPGIAPMPMAVPAQVTPLSSQSRPYVPVDSVHGSSEEVMSTVTTDRAAHLPQKTKSEIARAVASEVEKLV